MHPPNRHCQVSAPPSPFNVKHTAHSQQCNLGAAWGQLGYPAANSNPFQRLHTNSKKAESGSNDTCTARRIANTTQPSGPSEPHQPRHRHLVLPRSLESVEPVASASECHTRTSTPHCSSPRCTILHCQSLACLFSQLHHGARNSRTVTSTVCSLHKCCSRPVTRSSRCQRHTGRHCRRHRPRHCRPPFRHTQRQTKHNTQHSPPT